LGGPYLFSFTLVRPWLNEPDLEFDAPELQQLESTAESPYIFAIPPSVIEPAVGKRDKINQPIN
jgi:hypothetical protein